MLKDLAYYMSLNYTVSMTPIKPEEGGGILAEIPILQGCVSDGETHAEAAKNINEVKEEWFKYMLEHGYDIPEPESTLQESCDNIVGSFANVVKSFEQIDKLKIKCEEELSYYDRIICDIRHYCENHYEEMDSTKEGEVCKLLFLYSRKRRNIKDILQVIQPVASYIDNHKTIKNDIVNLSLNLTRKNEEIKGPRTYKPKVLVDLFKD